MALKGITMSVEAIPVTLLTGFLGSGKSTLLTRILSDAAFSDTAVVVNEFGDVGLDQFLVEHSDEQLVEMTSGCLCCTIRGDIRETLLDLHRRRALGQIPGFRRLVVETTGLADPAPVIHTLMTEERLTDAFVLGGVITTVDIVSAESTLSRHEECVKQIAVADRIVLTKTDLAKDPASQNDIRTLRDSISRMNPGAPILDRNDPGFDFRELFDTALYDPAMKGFEVQEWLNAEAYEDSHDAHDHTHDHAHDHAHNGHGHTHHDHMAHGHDVNRHGTEVQAYSLVMDEPVATMAFTVALELLIANQGADLLRVKGIVNLAEKPDKPVIIHGVQHVFHEPVWLDKWPSEDHRTKLVFITRNIPRETIDTFFRAWQRFGTDLDVKTPGA
jgi:G3E family GTPase